MASSTDVVRNILNIKLLQDIRAPIERARTLPTEAFTHPDFFKFEQEYLLASTWSAVDFGGRIPNVGVRRRREGHLGLGSALESKGRDECESSGSNPEPPQARMLPPILQFHFPPPMFGCTTTSTSNAAQASSPGE